MPMYKLDMNIYFWEKKLHFRINIIKIKLRKLYHVEMCAALHCFHTKKLLKNMTAKENKKLLCKPLLIFFCLIFIEIYVILRMIAKFCFNIFVSYGIHALDLFKKSCSTMEKWLLLLFLLFFFGTVMCFASRHYETFHQHRLQESVHSPYSLLSVCSFDWEHNYSHWISLLLIVSFRFVCVGEMLVFQCVHLRESIYS